MLRTGWTWEELKSCPMLEYGELVKHIADDEKRRAQGR